ADASSATTGDLLAASDSACDPDDGILIGAVGDLLLHERLQRQAYTAAGYTSLWSSFLPYLSAPDITYANLEGTTAAGVLASGQVTIDPGLTYDGLVYSTYPQFNYHPSLIPALLASGVDVVSTAN